MSGSARASVVVANLDDDVCEVLARVVEAAGHQAVRVTEADGVTRAVVAAYADALLLDVGAANLELLKELRSQAVPLAQTVRVVVVGSGPASARLAWQNGADAVLIRPFKSSEVGEALAASLARRDEERAPERQARIAALDG
ncbi:MAG: hypothetical protein JWM89_3499 [Acidimicrobiales bacterium]|nr:hypothetical protein [Acidimicrobiales bacterium]